MYEPTAKSDYLIVFLGNPYLFLIGVIICSILFITLRRLLKKTKE